ncbi:MULTISPECIES: hypothetical protein [unclassified Streptomyces]|uniref:hypothetical protein n=1 Tax=unclassified Streptomyces TaxID=2593676 RepID=UPI002473516A|nr:MULTISPECIES: hypothetical protein [unclassified Streptomyces]MDH6451721.1 hypothetical protein [Streptomyces sp. SAI-119]MDH6497722.1 hypothetical protein [Streptomyces sp. SAI-149]
MADSQSNALLRADAGTPTSGVIHVRTRLTADFTVLSNALAQRRGSAVTVGVAAYISSLPDGTPVTIPALCKHFREGEILISRALRELEEAGYLERRRERTPTGHVRTRTYFYDVPGGDPDSGPDPGPDPDGPPEPPRPRRPRKQPVVVAVTPPSAAVPETARASSSPAEAETPVPLADIDPKAVAVLTGLRRVDPRLILSAKETARLAPAVAQWLAAGLLPTHITDHLTARLPDYFLTRPVGILAYRLKETPLPVPARSAEPAVRPMVVPLRNCDGCERAFRSAEPGRCRDCRAGDQLRAVG